MRKLESTSPAEEKITSRFLMNRLLILIILISIPFFSLAQDVINFFNPSFEDVPRRGAPGMPSIRGWADCGFLEFPGESPPDILPLTEGNAWGVTKQAYDGQTYISMVTRQSGKYESVSQELSNPLLRGKCYNLKLYLALSPVYNSKTSASSDLESFSHPVVLRIWGGREKCDKFELLGQSDPVDHYEWKEYSFDVTIPLEIHSITLEAFYKNSSVEYNGHILVDHLSPMVEIECD